MRASDFVRVKNNEK